MADLVVVYEFIMLLTLELSSFRENGFLISLHFPLQPLIPLVGRLKAREGRIQKTDTHTDTQTHRTTTVTLVAHARQGLIMQYSTHSTRGLAYVLSFRLIHLYERKYETFFQALLFIEQVIGFVHYLKESNGYTNTTDCQQISPEEIFYTSPAGLKEEGKGDGKE